MAEAFLERGDRGQKLSATLYALSSGRPPAGVAVVRLTGPLSAQALRVITGRPPPAPRRASLRRLADPGSGAALDNALILWLPGPASFTGEDMAELHLHGGPAVVAGVLAALGRMEGLAQAGPGDFTRRAFGNGKLDLAEVEGLADLIAAETEGQRLQALAQAGGALSRACETWRERLIAAQAMVEAELEFGEEEGDVEARLDANVFNGLRDVEAQIAGHLASPNRGERLREGLQVALIGPPNSGKSSLINYLAGRDVAIVTDRPGTTRDVIEVHLNLGGWPVILLDTAGLRDTRDAIEAEGVARAQARAHQADLVLELVPAPERRDHGLAPKNPKRWRLLSKCDLTPELPPGEADAGPGARVFALSAATGAGVDALEAALGRWAGEALSAASPVLLTRERHREALRDCQAHLAGALNQTDLALAAEDLRLAARALGRITGRTGVEDVLDALFAAFCIGK